MALQTITFDPDARLLTDDEHIAAINAATANITRGSSVSALARPIEANEVTSVELSSSASKDNLDALSDVDRKYIRTLPVSGQFKVVNVQRNAAGEVEVTFDDVAIV